MIGVPNYHRLDVLILSLQYGAIPLRPPKWGCETDRKSPLRFRSSYPTFPRCIKTLRPLRLYTYVCVYVIPQERVYEIMRLRLSAFAVALGKTEEARMRFYSVLLITAFLGGYVANDVIRELGAEVVSPAFAYGDDLESAVEDIVEDCDVYVYDIDGGEGYGEIDC